MPTSGAHSRSLWHAWMFISLAGCGLNSAASSGVDEQVDEPNRAQRLDTVTMVEESAQQDQANSSVTSGSAIATAHSEPNGPLAISFDLLQPARYAQPDSSKLPQEILDLQGKRVRIRGFMLPGFQQTDIAEFVLVRDNLQCCFGGSANPFDCVLVRLDPKQSLDYEMDAITIEGNFNLEPADNTEFPVFYGLTSAKAF